MITFHAPDIVYIGAWNVITDVMIHALTINSFKFENAMAFAGANYLFMVPWYFIGWLFFELYETDRPWTLPTDEESTEVAE